MAMRQKRRQPNHRIHRRSIDHRGACRKLQAIGVHRGTPPRLEFAMRKGLQKTIAGTRAALAAAVLLGSPAAGASPVAAGVLARYIAVQALATSRPVTSCAD